MAETSEGIPLADGTTVVNPIQAPLNAIANALNAALVAIKTSFINSQAYILGTATERLELTAPRLREGISWVETDTGKTYNRRGGVWIVSTPVVNLGSAKRASGSAQGGIGASVAELTSMSVSINLPSAAKLRFLANVNTFSSSPADVIQIRIRDEAVSLAAFTRPANSSPTLQATSISNTVTAEADLAAGAHRINVAIMRIAGTGTVTSAVDATASNYLSVDRIG